MVFAPAAVHVTKQETCPCVSVSAAQVDGCAWSPRFIETI